MLAEMLMSGTPWEYWQPQSGREHIMMIELHTWHLLSRGGYVYFINGIIFYGTLKDSQQDGFDLVPTASLLCIQGSVPLVADAVATLTFPVRACNCCILCCTTFPHIF